MEYLSGVEKEAVEELKEALQKMLGDRLVGLYLFGSKARGDYGASSDIDIAVIVRGLTRSLKDAVFEKAADEEEYLELREEAVGVAEAVTRYLREKGYL